MIIVGVRLQSFSFPSHKPQYSFTLYETESRYITTPQPKTPAWTCRAFKFKVQSMKRQKNVN